MEHAFTAARWSQDSDGLWLSLKVENPSAAREFVETMQDKPYIADIKLKRKRRSLDANAYLWVLCQKIAEAVRNTTKEAVYQQLVRRVGQFTPLPIRNDAVESFAEMWESCGLGWFVVVDGDSTITGYTRVFAYHGSSSYDTREMSVLIDEAVSEAKELGIETMTPDELERMKCEWRR